MFVIGGEADADLNDVWAFNFQRYEWCKPDINGGHNFSPKRFHTATTIDTSKIITFGGCFSEYLHVNDLNLFDLKDFWTIRQITCTKIDVRDNAPETRWGHTAVAKANLLFVLGGRNDSDLSDMHCFDLEQRQWKKVCFGSQDYVPKARRRHSCVLIESCMITFGGFDGEFFNDLNILDLKGKQKGSIDLPVSTLNFDFCCLFDTEDCDITFELQF